MMTFGVRRQPKLKFENLRPRPPGMGWGGTYRRTTSIMSIAPIPYPNRLVPERFIFLFEDFGSPKKLSRRLRRCGAQRQKVPGGRAGGAKKLGDRSVKSCEPKRSHALCDSRATRPKRRSKFYQAFIFRPLPQKAPNPPKSVNFEAGIRFFENFRHPLPQNYGMILGVLARNSRFVDGFRVLLAAV